MIYKEKFNTATAVLSLISCILLWVVAILVCVAFGTRELLVSDGYSPFIRIGYFMACFDECGRPYCPMGDDDMFLHKCYHLWPWFQDDYYIEEQWDWLTPDWFKTSRILVIILIPLSFISAMLLTMTALIALAERNSLEVDKKRDMLLQLCLYVTAGLNLIGGVLGIAAVCIFYTNAFRRDWMPIPDKNHLGYSYWMLVVCSIFLVLSAVFCLIAGLFKTTVVGEKGEEEPMFSEDMRTSRA